MVFVSAASGAVGSVVCQLAKMQGAYVIGSAGRDDKIKWLYDHCNIDAALNYKKESVIESLPRLAPQGIDVYFDNVGGDHLIAAMQNINEFGRIVLCGMVSQYNLIGATLDIDLFPIITKRLTMRGFVQGDHMDLYDDFLNDMQKGYAEGKLCSNETILNGLESSPQALIDMLAGHYLGKGIVKI